jgi:hypothetical protein
MPMTAQRIIATISREPRFDWGMVLRDFMRELVRR